MRVAILAGGLGTRLAEETDTRPKPMVEIGGRPILWHILKRYSQFGVNDFAIALGYKGEFVKRFCTDYAGLVGSLSVNLASGRIDHHEKTHEDWQLHLVETGDLTNTGGRVKRVEPYVKGDTFIVTYGDGLADVDIDKLLAFHKSHGKLATVTTVQPVSRFGITMLDEHSRVTSFSEKPKVEGWVSAGFFVFDRRIFDYLDGGSGLILEKEPLERLAAEGQLMAYQHNGFFFAVDTYRDYLQVNELWREGVAPWKVWG
jgi:glucose-1-phosphate cytidylyltransferase